MSRLADPRATRTVDLGECECPGKPHPSDYVLVRADLSSSELSVLLRLPRMGEQEQAEVAATFVVEWNLLGPDGMAVPVSPAAMYALRGPTAEAIGLGLAESMKAAVKVPNPSGAPSAASRLGSASPTPTSTPTPGT